MAETYVSGALSAFFTNAEKKKYGSGTKEQSLDDSKSIPKEKKKKKVLKRKADVAVNEEESAHEKKAKASSLFNKYPDRAKPEPEPLWTPQPKLQKSTSSEEKTEPIKKKKKKIKEGDAETTISTTEEASPTTSTTERTRPLRANKQNQEKNERNKKKVKMTDEEKQRSVFVGNVPLDGTRKELTKLFTEFGKVESVRFRSAISNNVKLPKKAIVISKKFGDAKMCFNAYVKFADKESAEKALAFNGRKIRDHQLRVDTCASKKNYDAKTTVFVGNMLFKATEDQLIEHFSVCGEVDFVRIVRDSHSGAGKGFGFVGFKDSASTLLALNMNDQPFEGRPLRVTSIAKKNK
uniref:RRM domain-containing protein n=1 Tax=Plectus sambesii TaxID=2011161 RepID=A0A914WMC5_9BILA